MDEKEIIKSIQILNELFRSDFLQIKKINIDVDIIKNIIKKKKLEKFVDIFNNLSSHEQNSTESHVAPKKITKETPKEIPKESSISPTDSSSPQIDDSIAVTNFTVPSSMYNNKTTTSTNTNSIASVQ
jgi:hypothetical protein